MIFFETVQSNNGVEYFEGEGPAAPYHELQR